MNEAAFPERPTQQKKIKDYLLKIHETIQQMINNSEDAVGIVTFQRALSQFEGKDIGPTGVKVTVRFVYKHDLGEDAGWIIQKSKKNFDLFINMPPHMHLKKVFDERIGVVTDVYWAEFFDTFAHEYTHILDALKAPTGVIPFASYQNRPHTERPYEQRAWAEGYLELLRYKLETTDVAEVLKYLRNNGLMHDPTLRALKSENPVAWKRIMKHAVLGAVRNLGKVPYSTVSTRWPPRLP
jgi:hypothetical protein